MTDNRPEWVQTRVAKSDKDLWTRASKVAGLPLSQWLRLTLNRVARGELNEPAHSAAELLPPVKP